MIFRIILRWSNRSYCRAGARPFVDSLTHCLSYSTTCSSNKTARVNYWGFSLSASKGGRKFSSCKRKVQLA